MKLSNVDSYKLFQTGRTVMTSILTLLLLILLAAASQPALGQSSGSVTTNINDSGEQMGRNGMGIAAPPAAFTGAERPEAGSIRMSFPMFELPGRGLVAKLDLNYDSSLYQLNTNGKNWFVSSTVRYTQYPAYGFTLGYGMLVDHNVDSQCWVNQTSGYSTGICPPFGPPVTPFLQASTYIDETGAKHRFINGNSVDGSNLLYKKEGFPTVTYPDGTKVFFGAFWRSFVTEVTADFNNNNNTATCREFCDIYDRVYYPVKIEDRNGNFINIFYRNNVGPQISSIKDTLGRVINFNYDQTNNLVSIDVPGFTDGSRREAVRFYYKQVTRAHSFRDQTYTEERIKVLDYLYFPSSKNGWHFEHSSYGQIWLIEKLLKMDHDPATGSLTNFGTAVARTTYSYNGTPLNPTTNLLYTLPNYKERFDEWMEDPSQPMLKTTHKFTLDVSSEIAAKKSITYIEAPDGTTSAVRKRYYRAEDHDAFNWAKTWDEGTVLEEKIYRGQQVIQQVNYTWGLTTEGARLLERSVTDELGQKKRVVFNYYSLSDAGIKVQTNVREKLEYAFDGTTVLRKTIYDYVRDANWTNRWLVKLPKSVKVYAGSNSNPISQVEYEYDAEPLTSYDDLTTTPSKMYDTATPAQRGNITKTTTYTNAAQPTQGATIVSKAKYDIAGNVVEKTDGNNNVTQIEFSADYWHAYQTLTRTPAPDSTGNKGSASGFETKTVYNFNTGLVTSTKDPNDQPTTNDYNDPVNRIKRTDMADGGAVVYEYSDEPGNLFVLKKVSLDGTRFKESYQFVNGRGQQIRTQNLYGDGLYSTVDTEFDTLGRVSRTSQPYLTTLNHTPSPDTRVWTVTSHDALGRILNIQAPDNTKVASEYDGTRVLVTDPATHQRLSKNNELGQLTDVWEILPSDSTDPNAESVSFPNHPEVVKGYHTSYQYDVVNNLRKVQQGVQTRFFMYDSLSRLLKVKLAEQEANSNLTETDPLTQNSQWSIAYDYDNNGNMRHRTDARGVLTTYEYDGLNRVTSRSYTNEPTQTPTASYKYDGAGIAGGIANSKNKITEVSTSGAFVSKCTYDQFDVMGRVRQSTVTIESGEPYVMRYGYDFANNLISETYPSGRTINFEIDKAGRLAGIRKQGSNNYYAGGEPESTSSIQYTAHNAVKSLRLGNGLWETTDYDPLRLQISHLKLGRNPNGAERLQIDYDYSTLNNGNVRGQTITVPTIGAVGGFTVSQAYDYDTLNRLKTVVEAGGASQNFDYDQFGNRALTSGFMPDPQTPQQLSAFEPTSNRLKSKEYDKVGNITRDAINQGRTYQYDGENRLRTVDSGGTATYSYDAEGRRVKKATSAGTTLYVYDNQGQLVAEYGVSPPIGGGGTSYLTTDNLGSARVITGMNINDDKGGVKSRHDYLPFGEELGLRPDSQRNTNQGYAGSSDNFKHKFTGYERDKETGLDFAKSRYYGSSFGRFTSPDPLLTSAKPSLPQTLNRYVYVGNNPLKFVDPSGLEWYYNISDAINNHRYAPQWFSGNPGPGWELWIKFRDYSYCSNVNGQCYALNPYGPDFKIVGSLGQAQKVVHNYKEAEFAKPLQEIGRQVAPIPKFTAGFVAVGAAGGGAAGLGLAAAGGLGSGLTTLGLDSASIAASVPEVTASNLTIMGRLADTRIFQGLRGYNVLNVANEIWSLRLNEAWVDAVIRARSTVYLVTPLEDIPAGSVTALEIQQLLQAGYTQVGPVFLPPILW